MESPDHYDLEYGMAVAFRLEAMRRLQQRLRDQEESHSTGGQQEGPHSTGGKEKGGGSEVQQG